MPNSIRHLVVCSITLSMLAPSPLAAGDDDPATPTFKRHVVDDDFEALGADIGDRTRGAMADILAVDRSSLYWYAGGEKHLIDRFDTPTNFLLVRTADVDRDGDADAIAVDHTNGNIFYYENPRDPSRKKERWPRHVVDDRVRGAHAVAIGDIDRDGRPDVVASGEAECDVPDTIFWYRCPEEPNAAARWERYAIGPGQGGGLAHYPGIGDVNGDGRPDVVHAAKNDTPLPDRSPPVRKGEWYRMWIQPEDPRQPWRLTEVGIGYRQATNIQVADVNGDEFTDLIATQGHHVGLLWFEGPNWRPRYVDRTLKSPHSLAVADIDGDGDIDFATCAFESRVLAWFENDGKGGFQRHDIHSDQEAYDLVARDVDGDGDLDLLVAGRGSRNVVWYEQVREAVRLPGGSKEREARAARPSKEAELRDYALKPGGDPARGERLFMLSERLSCIRCHAVGAAEGGSLRAGPDLAGVGSKYSRPDLIRSILRPSDFVLPGYETTVLVTRDGRTHQGVLGAVEPEALVLVDASGASWPVRLRDIEKRSTTGASFMPQDLP